MFSYLLNQNSSWEKLKETKEPIAVYGTGDGADKVFAEFNRLGIEPKYVVASDSFARERTFHGFKVLPISKLESEIENFTVALAFASPRDEVIDNIKAISTRHTLIMPSVPVYGEEIFNKDYLKDNLPHIEKAYSALSDEKSKEVFKSIIEFQITGNLRVLFNCESEKEEALSLIELTNSENYLDLGAYRGDTIDELLSFSGGYQEITALEPDSRSFRKLSEHCENMENVNLINAVVSNATGAVSFGGNKGRGGSINKDGNKIPSITIDSINKNFTYIKADVEGEELPMLLGAKSTLRRKPKLNIAVYHRSEDIFTLVNKIKEINPEYEIYLRHHKHISFWDTNLYCK